MEKQNHGKKYIASAICALIIVLLVGLSIALIISEIAGETLSTIEFIFVVISILFLFTIIFGILLALWQRIKQIKGGEEDAAAKY